MTDRAQLIEQLTEEIYRRMTAGPRAVRDQVCADCTGQCASRCAFKMPDLLGAGAERISASAGTGPMRRDVARLIDHTILKPDATRKEIEKLCAEAAEHGFMSVCVNPTWVKLAAASLKGSGVAVCTVIGFPLGASTSETKAQEAVRAQDDGAVELDMVIQIGRLKSGEIDVVRDDIAAVVGARRRGSLVKVIIETCFLSDDEKKTACRLAKEAGADFVKTSTGFGSGGATAADIALMRAAVGPSLGVKASGGVRDYGHVLDMVRAGATRIGASAGVKIVQEAAR
jgi:deoxyribose-phosphate aldolase